MDGSSREALQYHRLRDASVYLAFFAVAIIVLVTQNRVVGWEPGYNELQSGHHGWVSSQTLAIIANAEAENSFVGYAQTYVDDEGNKNYDYFDRYPVFFSAGMHIILSLKTKLSTQIYLAKQVMNLIFILTIAAAFALVNKIVRNRVIALSVVMLSVSSQYLLFYKDMIHYDQPALLGLIFLIYAITVYKIDGNRWLVYFAGLISISIGRGYASYSVLLIWLLVEALDQIKERGIPLRKKVRKIIRHDAFRVLLLAIAWGAICLLYNIGIEAARRGIPFIQTSIIQSATTRLALNKDFNDSYMNTLNWGVFIKDQMVRLIRWSFPIWNYKGTFLQNINILAIVFSIIGLYTRMLDSVRKTVLLIMVFSGIFWLFIMRNLSAFHDYTAMYYLGIPLAFYAACSQSSSSRFLQKLSSYS